MSDLRNASIEDDKERDAAPSMKRKRVAARVKRKKACLGRAVKASEASAHLSNKTSTPLHPKSSRHAATKSRHHRLVAKRTRLKPAVAAAEPAGPPYRERVSGTFERIGRIRDIDIEQGVFLAILNGRTASDPEIVGRFPISLVDPSDLGLLDVGVEFTLATGQRVLVSDEGSRAKPSLQTTIVVHRPAPLSPEREERARARGRAVHARLTAE